MDLGVEGAALRVVIAIPIDDVEVQLRIGHVEIANIQIPWIFVSIFLKLLQYFRRKPSFKALPAI